jgi:poly-gamma-glutamate synthesis protein (capsule biosynthesis protein)
MVIHVNDRVKRRQVVEWTAAALLGSLPRMLHPRSPLRHCAGLQGSGLHALARPCDADGGASTTRLAISGASLPNADAAAGSELTLFLCGDVMTGRGIDQVLKHPVNPRLYEPYVKSAREYVTLAEHANGPLPKPVEDAYIWGDALATLDRLGAGVRIVNLETSVTTSDSPWPGKGIHYRMHPANVGCLTAARLDCCVLANNHVMDWGRSGLVETLATLHAAGIRSAGAGRDRAEAAAPAAIGIADKARVLVFAYGMPSSGVPASWAATDTLAGINVLSDLSSRTVAAIARNVNAHKRPGDVVVLSIHWGGNWGYGIDGAEQQFARRIVDTAGVDIVHGHSSHHPKGIEVHRDRLILYGSGDLLDDYEGITGYEEFRADLGFLYLPTINTTTGSLTRLILVPTRIRRFRLNRANAQETAWLAAMENREGRALGTRAVAQPDGTLRIEWQ